MKRMKNSLKFKVFCYMIFFSLIILSLLWFSQVFSLNSYYEFSTKRDINKVVSKVKKSYDEYDYESYFNKLSFDNDMCIEIYDYTSRVYYSSSCNARAIELSREKIDFISKNYVSQGYEVTDSKLDSKYLLYGVKLEDGIYAFVEASLLPVDSTVSILKEQLFLVSIFVFFLAFLVAMFISRKISRPIEQINENAKNIASGKYDVVFENDSTVSEISELNDTLRYTSLELAKTEKLRQELLANVSHDLKTPLTMIKAYAEMVRDLSYKDKVKRESNLNVIITESDRLNLLVNDILDLSKYQANTIKLEYSEFDINLLIKDILKRYDIYRINDSYVIEYEPSSKFVIADFKRIEQVIYNLINNAINYTGEDKKIFIKVIDLKDKDVIRVEVSDTGSGISDKDLPLIWDKYYKVDKTYSRVQVGSGIGLSIVKNILELHKANYGVLSKLKKGTTFYFELKRSDKSE